MVTGLILLSLAADTAIAQDWTLTSAPQAGWNSVTSSADGTKLTAVSGWGLIYSSADSGATWAPTSAPAQWWTSIACSADGAKLVAAADRGLYVSSDFGATWTQVFSPAYHTWNSAASSSDGKRLVAASSDAWWYTNAIYVSTNSGADWVRTSAPSEFWYCVTSSADGSRLAAGCNGGASGAAVYISEDFGVSWRLTCPTSEPWDASVSVAASATAGTLLTACSSGALATSADWGATWRTAGDFWFEETRASVACSAEGVTLAAVESDRNNGTRAFVSTNAGTLWSATSLMYGTNRCSVSSSADGTQLVLALSYNGIYVLRTTPFPALNLRPSASGLQLSWLLPSRTFVLQESPDLFAWLAVQAAPVLNLTNLHYEVGLPVSAGPRFYRLASQ